MADAHALTEKLLEVLPVCTEELKKDAITFLPEVATEMDHEVRPFSCSLLMLPAWVISGELAGWQAGWLAGWSNITRSWPTCVTRPMG